MSIMRVAQLLLILVVLAGCACLDPESKDAGLSAGAEIGEVSQPSGLQ